MADKDNPTIAAVSEEAQKLLSTTFEKLIESTTVKVVEGDIRLFFPNGIELIHVKVEAGLTEKTKVSVEVKIAGEKGIKADAIEPVGTTESVVLEAEPTAPE